MSVPTSQAGGQGGAAGGLAQEPIPTPSVDNLTAQNAAAALSSPSPSRAPTPPSAPSNSSYNVKSIVSAIKRVALRIQWKGNIGTIATVLSLIAAMVYGPPAWKLAQAQLTLAIQGMRLSQWATCADHDEIQNTTTCRNILNTDFDTIGKRSLRVVKLGLSWISFTMIWFSGLTVIVLAWIVSVFVRSYNSQPKLSRADQHELARVTHFTRQEVQQWYKGFMKDVPSGQLSLREFQRIYRLFFPSGNPDRFAALVFKRFDSNSSSSIDFPEFLSAISITSRGSLVEKCAWAFKLYDLNDNGKISYDNMLVVVRAIYEMMGSSVQLAEDEATPELRVAKMWPIFDIGPDGTINERAFIEGCIQDPTIVEAFNIYNDLI